MCLLGKRKKKTEHKYLNLMLLTNTIKLQISKGMITGVLFSQKH